MGIKGAVSLEKGELVFSDPGSWRLFCFNKHFASVHFLGIGQSQKGVSMVTSFIFISLEVSFKYVDNV